MGGELARLRDDVAEDRHRLEEIATHVGADVNSTQHRLSQATLSVLGRLTRMLHTRGELGGISEVEKLRDAVAAKLAGWETLLVASATDGRLPRTKQTACAPSTCRWPSRSSTTSRSGPAGTAANTDRSDTFGWRSRLGGINHKARGTRWGCE